MGGDLFWIVVMNATRARILRTGLHPPGAGDPGELVLRCAHRQLRALLAGKAPPDGPAVLRRDMQDFRERVIDVLCTHLAAGDFVRFALVADRDTLARMRDALPRALAVRLVATHAADMAHLPPKELAAALARILTDAPRPA
jgi:hypothetical protein